jgi:hypothetical protein
VAQLVDLVKKLAGLKKISAGARAGWSPEKIRKAVSDGKAEYKEVEATKAAIRETKEVGKAVFADIALAAAKKKKWRQRKKK